MFVMFWQLLGWMCARSYRIFIVETRRLPRLFVGPVGFYAVPQISISATALALNKKLNRTSFSLSLSLSLYIYKYQFLFFFFFKTKKKKHYKTNVTFENIVISPRLVVHWILIETNIIAAVRINWLLVNLSDWMYSLNGKWRCQRTPLQTDNRSSRVWFDFYCDFHPLSTTWRTEIPHQHPQPQMTSQLSSPVQCYITVSFSAGVIFSATKDCSMPNC